MTSEVNRVAVNTVIMYIRMLFLMLLSFYTSRLLLSTLGIEDFGIYSVVGSVSATFLSLKELFSESVQRFLNFEKGRGSVERQQMVFTFSVVIHITLALLFVIIVEPIGCWLIDNKLVIPEEKISTAFFVFHVSVVSVVVSIFEIPFNALVIANERFGLYAFISIIDAVLKLIAVLLLDILPFEHLKAYSLLLLVVPIFTFFYFSVYCIRRFDECRLTKVKDRKMIREIFSLSGWNFFGNISFSLVHEGINMLLNMFGGLAYNAARTIAYQAKGATSKLTNSTMMAVRPQIMQRVGVVQPSVLFRNIISVSRIAFLTILMPVSILLPYTYQLLDIWLVDVPEYSTVFMRLILAGITIRSLHEPLNMMYMAFASIKRMIIIEAFSMLLFLLIIFVSLKMGAPIWSAFAILAVMEAMIITALLVNARFELGFSVWDYVRYVVVPFIGLSMLCCVVAFLFSRFVPVDSALGAIVGSVVVCIIYCAVAWFVLDTRERGIVKGLLRIK